MSAELNRYMNASIQEGGGVRCTYKLLVSFEASRKLQLIEHRGAMAR